MRAVLMGSTALLARMLYRPYAALNALGFAAFVQLLFSSKVIYNLGFQLSYAAVAGILAWYGPFRQLLNSLERLPYAGGYLRDLLAVSLAAQLGTLGLSWAYFGQFPLYFLVANLVAIPLSTLLSYTGFLWLLTLKVPFSQYGFGMEHPSPIKKPHFRRLAYHYPPRQSAFAPGYPSDRRCSPLCSLPSWAASSTRRSDRKRKWSSSCEPRPYRQEQGR